ncbi:glycosyltransferase family 2 protein [Insolitispirillum peregrinum]|uniref:Dolichol-phosphate mannosyltransferase n=1 Tax=Insolitispirillum peregrinum TaxID=80876 RepID=A0A1N7PW31_9PROT|nr:glycosyltransferase family 2 protein [Insolitispirillum peregrinum]SIT14760.1 dolichol-phosphate mannosyltransferase [Insolitispirillum peregrinum]
MTQTPSSDFPAPASVVLPPDVAVVVPVKNEADNIFPLIREIHAALNGVVPFEIIYVDDGSDDETPARLDEAQREFPMLRVVRHANSCGQSQAVHSGVRAACAPWVATLDGDGQNDPADIPAMLAERDRQATANNVPLAMVMIAGHRQKRQDNGLRKLSSRVANGIRSSMLKDDTPDSGCGLKLFARATFLAFPRFDHMHRFLPALMRREGGVVLSVRVNHRPRERGVSKYGLWNRLWVGIVDLFGVWWLQRRARNPRVVRQDPGQTR